MTRNTTAILLGTIVVLCIIIAMLLMEQQQQPRLPSSNPIESSTAADAVVEDAPSSGTTPTRRSMLDLVSALLAHHSGVWNGVFDPWMLQRKRNRKNRYIPCEAELHTTPPWSMQSGIYQYPGVAPQPCMANVSAFAHTVHYLLSLGLSRMALDTRMDRMYASVPEASDFEVDVARFVAGYLNAAQIALQIWADAYTVRPADMMAEIRKCSQQEPPPQQNSSGSSRAARWLRRKARYLPLFEPLKWVRPGVPVNGRFWNSFNRATVGCTSLSRTCENPEGCRLMCNMEYALLPASPSPSGGFEMVGFGSNNEFDWEDSMIDAIRNTPGARLRSITTFDCTLASRKIALKPSATVKSVGNRFRFVPFCLGAADPVIDVGDDQKVAAQDNNPARFFGAAKAIDKTASMAELRPILEWQDKATSELAFRAERARKVHLLKMDIESFEFIAMPRWLRLELHQIAKQRKSTASRPQLIDFEAAPFLDVDQIQVEIHRRGYKHDKAAGPIGALWMMWNQLFFYALGFAPVGAEKNHFDNCCYEQVWTSYAFFVKSEAFLRK